MNIIHSFARLRTLAIAYSRSRTIAALSFSSVLISTLGFIPSALGQSTVPLTTVPYEGRQLAVPDWAGITHNSIDASSLTLGDSAGRLDAQKLNSEQLYQLLGYNTSDVTLDNLGELIEQQSVADLVDSIDGLENLTPTQVAPVNNLLQSKGLSQLSNTKFSELLSNPTTKAALMNLSLGDAPLSSYSIDSILNLKNTPFDKFKNWQNVSISEIIGLGDVSFKDLPGFPSFDISKAMVGLFDVAYGQKEARRIDTVTGSYVQGFQVPCNQPSCEHMELTDPIPLPSLVQANSLHGKQWISGRSQKVLGGDPSCPGPEPTGRHPYGPIFKMVLTAVNESQGSATFTAYFDQYCGKFDRTPYIFRSGLSYTVYEKDYIILGFDP